MNHCFKLSKKFFFVVFDMVKKKSHLKRQTASKLETGFGLTRSQEDFFFVTHLQKFKKIMV